MTVLRTFIRDESGADLIEYAVIAAVLAVACIAAMKSLNVSLNGFFTTTGTTLGTLVP
jgi:Flp pilus assembly pilin Flp